MMKLQEQFRTGLPSKSNQCCLCFSSSVSSRGVNGGKVYRDYALPGADALTGYLALGSRPSQGMGARKVLDPYPLSSREAFPTLKNFYVMLRSSNYALVNPFGREFCVFLIYYHGLFSVSVCYYLYFSALLVSCQWWDDCQWKQPFDRAVELVISVVLYGESDRIGPLPVLVSLSSYDGAGRSTRFSSPRWHRLTLSSGIIVKVICGHSHPLNFIIS